MEAVRLTGAQQAAGGGFGRGRRGQALALGGHGGGGGGEEGGEVEAGALAHGAEDGRGRVGGHGERVVRQAHR